MANIVAIVGRPNVGKSTLFNRMVEKRDAIMDDESGVTRDRHYGTGEWVGRSFTVIDTGGYVSHSDDVFEEAIRKQVEVALDEATVIIFMVDCKTGITDLDAGFAKILRRSKKPVLIAANKADNKELLLNANEFYNLGFGDIYPISSASGSGTGELLDRVTEYFTDEKKNEEDDTDIPKLAILGRPNVGKSSFLNILLKEDRSIVTEIAGTTRDAIHTHYKYYGKNFLIYDTAGLRKKSKVKEDIEFYSVLRSVKALEASDVCIILLDATKGIESQDMHIISLAHKNRKGILLLVNKWDLVEKDEKTADEYRKFIRERLGPMQYIPILFTSMLTKQRVFQAMEMANTIYINKHKKINTSKLNEVMLNVINKNPPPATRGQYIKIKYVTQYKGDIPNFLFFCNYPKYIKPPYKRYLENQLRENFDFTGVPLKILFRKK